MNRDHMHADAAIRESDERFRNVARATADAIWDWDLESDGIWWNEGIQTLFGFSPGDIEPGSEAWSLRIHPEDRDRVLRGIHAVIDSDLENWSAEYRFVRKDGSYAHVLDRGFVIRGNGNIAVRMVGGMTDQSERHRATEQLRESEAQYRLLFDNNPHPMWVYEMATLRLLAVNAAAIGHYGYTRQEFLAMTLCDFRPAEDLARLEQTVGARPEERKISRLWRHLKKDGSMIDAEVVDHAIDFNGKSAGLVLANDVTERLRTQRELASVSRAQQMLSACNEALIRVEDEAALLEKICRICVEIGGYRMAWVGFAHEDESRLVVPMAHAGDYAGYLEGIQLSLCDDQPLARTPLGRAIRDNEAVIVSDLAKEPTFARMLARAEERGYRGAVCLPLRDKEHVFGALSLYTAQAVQASADEVKLLQALADNLAFGIGNIRHQLERRQFQMAAMTVGAGVFASTGTAFFKQLASNMAKAVGAQAAFVAQLLPGAPSTARTVAVVIDGNVSPNFDYVLDESACETLLANPGWFIADRISELLPCSPVLPGLGMRGCVGRRLENSAGDPAGVLFVLFREPLTESDRQSDFIASILRIFAARASAELERREADARIREQASLLDKAKDAIVVRGLDNRIRFWNKGAERLYGWTADEVVGRSIEEILYHDLEAHRNATRDVMERGDWSGEINERRKDGSLLTVEAHWTLVQDEIGRPQSILAIKTDITQRKAAEREIQYLAFYDPLTRLPNRQLLMDRLQHALERSARSDSEGALLFIDLDNFKTINDTLGHDMGDLLLQQVAGRLVACVRKSDTVARLGGDEFVVMLENLGVTPDVAAERVKATGEKILAALNQPYLFERYEHYSTPSIGVSLFKDHRDSIGELLKRADLAMYQAKAAGRNTLRFFDPAMQAAVSARAALEADLRQGLREREFLLHYQPQFDGDGAMTGVEALLRWEHPGRGLVSPEEFIPLAEETGLILCLGQWVLETACTQLAAWSARTETAHFCMAVNVSARQFRHPNFMDMVLSVLDRTGADPCKLKLELTESVLVDNADDTIAKMSALKEKGIGFLLDDFGTGYSSLAYLKRLPLDALKIDRSFVSDVPTDPNDGAIARTIMALANSLGLAVIAEGVETVAQRDFLARHGCHAYQGYLFSRPLPVDRLEEFMRIHGQARA
jgi:diguanylate cyclase (GGDEF)-like protein/PAS domain S-box-containing protein